MGNRAKKIAITDKAFFAIMAKLVRVKNSTTETLFARWAAPSESYPHGEGVKGVLFKVAKCLENFERSPQEKRHITVRFCSNKREGNDSYEFVLHFDLEEFKFEGTNTPQLNHVTILKMSLYKEWQLAFHLQKEWNRGAGNDNVKKIVFIQSVSQETLNDITNREDAKSLSEAGSEIAIIFHGAKARNVMMYSGGPAKDITMKRFTNTLSILEDCHTLPI